MSYLSSRKQSSSESGAAGFDWTDYRTGGALRQDSFTGMSDEFRGGLERMFSEAPADIRAALSVSSGFRSVQRQEQLWQEALKKYGSPEDARKWVAPPGNSQHGFGSAADMKFGNDAARAYARENAGNYGLAFPLDNEPWHVELASARGGGGGAVAGGSVPPGRVDDRFNPSAAPGAIPDDYEAQARTEAIRKARVDAVFKMASQIGEPTSDRVMGPTTDYGQNGFTPLESLEQYAIPE